jgi:hypothetical protein
MIKILSKPKKDYKDLETHPTENWMLLRETFPIPDRLFYFEKDGKEFMYVDDLCCFVIPKESRLTVKEILGDTEIDLSNWTLSKVSSEVPYILNQLKYGGMWREDEDWPIPEEDLTGTWVLRGEDTEIEFSIKQGVCDWNENKKEYYFGFPEKAIVPRDSALIDRKTYFIFNLLWKKLQ